MFRLNRMWRSPASAQNSGTPTSAESAAPSGEDGFEVTSASAAPQPVPLRARQLAPLRGNAIDMAAATYPGDVYYGREEYDEAEACYRRCQKSDIANPVPLLKLILLFEKRKSGEVSTVRAQLAKTVPAAVNRSVAWMKLYYDRSCESSHNMFGLTLRRLLEYAEVADLSPLQKQIFLERSGTVRETLLDRAAERGRTEDVEVLLKLGAPREWLASALLRAIDAENPNKVYPILEAGVLPAAPQYIEKLARLAARSGDDDLLSLVLSKGMPASQRVAGVGGDIAIQQLVIESRRAVVEKLMVLRKAGVDILLYPKPSQLPSPVRIAIGQNATALLSLFSLGLDPNYVDPNTGNTPLMDVVEEGAASCITPLLRLGADPNVKHAGGYTAAELAVARERHACIDRLARNEVIAARLEALGPYATRASEIDVSERLLELPEACIESAIAAVAGLRRRLAGYTDANERFLPTFLLAFGRAPDAADALVKLCESARTFQIARERLQKLLAGVYPPYWAVTIDSLPWLGERDDPFRGHVAGIGETANLLLEHGGEISTLEILRAAGKVPAKELDVEQAVKVMRIFGRAWNFNRNVDWLVRYAQRDFEKDRNAAWRVANLNLVLSQAALSGHVPDDEEHLPSAPPPPEAGTSIFTRLLGRKRENPLPPTLRAALESTRDAPPLAWRELPTLDVDGISEVQQALTDELVHDRLNEAEVMRAYVELLKQTLGPETLGALLDLHGIVQPKALRALQLRVHPDRVDADSKGRATALFALLTGTIDTLKATPQAAALAAIIHAPDEEEK